jgi:hypothetical protein
LKDSPSCWPSASASPVASEITGICVMDIQIVAALKRR